MSKSCRARVYIHSQLQGAHSHMCTHMCTHMTIHPQLTVLTLDRELCTHHPSRQHAEPVSCANIFRKYFLNQTPNNTTRNERNPTCWLPVFKVSSAREIERQPSRGLASTRGPRLLQVDLMSVGPGCSVSINAPCYRRRRTGLQQGVDEPSPHRIRTRAHAEPRRREAV